MKQNKYIIFSITKLQKSKEIFLKLKSYIYRIFNPERESILSIMTRDYHEVYYKT